MSWVDNVNNNFFPAPSAAPVDLTLLSATSSSITLQWMAVPCIHQNGNITGYMIEYEEVDDKSGALSMNISIVGSQNRMIAGSITGLRPLTHYDIRVAAVNSAGIGPFTHSSNASTLGIALYTHQSFNFCWSFLNPALPINDPNDDIVITDASASGIIEHTHTPLHINPTRLNNSFC